MSHVDEGTLHAMLDGELTGQEVAAVQAHLRTCAHCRALLDEARDFVSEADALVETLDEPAAPTAPAAPPAGERHQRPRWLRPRTLAVAATLTIAAGAGVIGIALRDKGTPTVLRQPAVVTEDATAGPRPSTVLTDSTALAGREREGTEADLAKASRDNAVSGGAARDEDAVPSAEALEERVAQAEPTVGANQVPAPADEQADAAGADDAPARQVAGAPAAAPALAPDRREAEVAKRSDSPAELVGRAGEDGFADAVLSLGGTIKLIDGRTAVRIERDSAPRLEGAEVQSALVRVVYQDESDREFVLEQVRVAFDGAAGPRAQASAAEAGAAQQREAAVDFLRVTANDTVVSQETDSTVRIRWVDQDGFLLALIGRDEAFLRELMTRIR